MIRGASDNAYRAARKVAFHLPAPGAIQIAKFSELFSLSVPAIDAIPEVGEAGPAIAAAGSVATGAALPPAVGGAIPPWLLRPPPPGFFFNEPARMAVPNPDWVEALRLHIQINQAQIDPQILSAVELPWPWLSMKQKELFAEGEAIDAGWDAAFPGIKAATIRYVDGFWESQEAWAKWDADVAAGRARCSRVITPDELEDLRRECLSLQDEVNVRLEQLKQKDAATIAAFERDVKAPVEANSAKIEAYLKKVDHWYGKVLDYNKAASQALTNARKPDIVFIDRLVKKYGLDKCQRQVLHLEIRGQNYSDEEIEEIARELGATRRGRCPRQGEGGQ